MEMSAVDARLQVPLGWPRAIVLDLDGTLIDSLPDIAAALNELLSAHGLKGLSCDVVRPMLGKGIRQLVAQAFSAAGQVLDAPELDRRTNMVIGHYSRRLTDKTVLMPGAKKMVRALAARGVRLGVVTNRPELATRAILDHFALTMSFAVIVGGDTGPRRKPAPDMLRHAATALGCTVEDSLMIGDGPADAQSARAAGMRFILVRGQHPSPMVDALGANAVIDGLFDLPRALDRLADLTGSRRRILG